MLDWEEAILTMFNAVKGDSRFQSLWEFVTLLISLISWRDLAKDAWLCILGDNIAALQDALNLRGNGNIRVVAREIAWRQA